MQAPVAQYAVPLTIGVKNGTNTMPTKIAHRRETLGHDEIFNHPTDFFVISSGLANLTRRDPAIIGRLQ